MGFQALGQCPQEDKWSMFINERFSLKHIFTRYIHRLPEINPYFFKERHFWKSIYLHRAHFSITAVSFSLYPGQHLTHSQENLQDLAQLYCWNIEEETPRDLSPKCRELYWMFISTTTQPSWHHKLSYPKGVIIWGQRRTKWKEAAYSQDDNHLTLLITFSVNLHFCANGMTVLAKPYACFRVRSKFICLSSPTG